MRIVQQVLGPASTDLCRRLTEEEFNVSPKTTIAASRPALAAHFQRLLGAAGFEVKSEREVKDLGIGRTAQRRRGVRHQRAWLQRGSRRAGRIKVLGRIDKRAKKLFATGAFAQAAWSAGCTGLAEHKH